MPLLAHMCLPSVSPFYNQQPTVPYEESSWNMDPVMSFPHLTPLTSSLFSLGKCPWILVPCSQPFLCHVVTSLVLSYVLLQHPSQFPPLPHWTISSSETRQCCFLPVSPLTTLSLAGIFPLPLWMSGELPSQHIPSLRSPLSHHPWSPSPSSSCCCTNCIPLSFCMLLHMSPQPKWDNQRVETLS